MYEHKSQPILAHRLFMYRMLRHGGYAAALIGASLVVGMAGYHLSAGYGFVDAFLETSMLLGGMGPVGALPGASAKVFAGFFALYSGLVFLIAAGLLLAPVFHRVLHRFHAEERE